MSWKTVYFEILVKKRSVLHYDSNYFGTVHVRLFNKKESLATGQGKGGYSITHIPGACKMSVISIRHHRGSLVPVSTHYMKNDIFKPRGGGGIAQGLGS